MLTPADQKRSQFDRRNTKRPETRTHPYCLLCLVARASEAICCCWRSKWRTERRCSLDIPPRRGHVPRPTRPTAISVQQHTRTATALCSCVGNQCAIAALINWMSRILIIGARCSVLGSATVASRSTTGRACAADFGDRSKTKGPKESTGSFDKHT
jgi:hypothetical protein